MDQVRLLKKVNVLSSGEVESFVEVHEDERTLKDSFEKWVEDEIADQQATIMSGGIESGYVHLSDPAKNHYYFEIEHAGIIKNERGILK